MNPETPLACPYKGLMPFSSDDAPLFFGRAAECRLLVTHLHAYPTTVIYGRNGIGKSSLLAAGVLPQL